MLCVKRSPSVASNVCLRGIVPGNLVSDARKTWVPDNEHQFLAHFLGTTTELSLSPSNSNKIYP